MFQFEYSYNFKFCPIPTATPPGLLLGDNHIEAVIVDHTITYCAYPLQLNKTVGGRGHIGQLSAQWQSALVVG